MASDAHKTQVIGAARRACVCGSSFPPANSLGRIESFETEAWLVACSNSSAGVIEHVPTMSRELKVAPGESIDRWIERQPKGAVLRALRSLIHEQVPHLQEQVKWSNPWYSGHSNVVYLASQNGYATFGVCNGAYLDDPHGLLEGTGKAMRHVKVYDLDEILRGQLRDLLTEAIAFDRTNGNG